MVDNDLEQLFHDSVAFVQSSETNYKPSKTMKLKMYALYKQAVEGDVNIKKPGILDVVGRAKYTAWLELKGMSSEKAKQTYVDEVALVREKLGV